MATNIFLGNPPENIKQFIIENYGKQEEPVDMTKVPLHFTANEDGSSVSLACFDQTDTYDFIDSWCKLDYSMDGKTWQTYIDPDSSDETLRRGKVINLNKDETVYFKATLGDVEGNPNLNGFAREYGYIWHYFVMEGSIKADGNIQFLLENTGTKMDVPDHCYYQMFYNYLEDGDTALTQAPVLPAETLANYCYQFMFQNCTSLTQAPELPATTLANSCYRYMFRGCTSLTQTPELPATTLADQCYTSMFNGCSSLTQAPELPATTLASRCYSNMFDGCTSLTQAPELPATTLASNCYSVMFSGCTNLNNINVNFSAWDPSSATDYWVKNVASSGTFTCPEGLPEEFGNNRIPTGWTVVRK